MMRISSKHNSPPKAGHWSQLRPTNQANSDTLLKQQKIKISLSPPPPRYLPVHLHQRHVASRFPSARTEIITDTTTTNTESFKQTPKKHTHTPPIKQTTHAYTTRSNVTPINPRGAHTRVHHRFRILYVSSQTITRFHRHRMLTTVRIRSASQTPMIQVSDNRGTA